MGSPERTRSTKRDTEESFDLKSPKDDEDLYEGDDKRKHRSSKSRKSNNHLEESKKRSVGSGEDYDEYESRRESRLKQMKKKQEESALEKLSNWYQDGEGGDNRHDGGDNKSRRKSSSRKHDERSNDADIEKAVDERESRSDRRENSRERSHNSRRRLDESDSATRKIEDSEETESRSGRSNDHDNKQEKTRERSLSAKTDQSDIIKTRVLDPSSEKEDGKSKTPEENSTLIENSADEDANNSNTWTREKDRRSEKDNYRNNRDNRDYQGRPGGRDRPDYQSRPGGSRKDIGIRTEAVKTSSNYGISNENYDVIEIQTKPFDHGRDDSAKSSQNDDDHNARDNVRFIDEKGRGGQKGNLPNRSGGSQNSPLIPQGYRGNRGGGGGGGGGGQKGKLPMPMMSSPFGPLGMMPAVPMSPAPGPPMSPAVFIPPFSPPVWPGLSPVPTGPRFPLGTPPSPAMYLRGPPNPNFNPILPTVRLQPQDNININISNTNKPSGGWVPPARNIGGAAGKAPSRGEQNDYSQNFVDTGMRPQNFIRELELTSVVEDYPKLRELIQKKDEIVAKSASTPMYYKCDLREQVLTPELFGTKFDVILVDPPWEEYVHRAPGVTDHMDYWTLEEIMNLKIEAIADTPSFIFLWVGDGVGLEQGRQCLKKWGFRRCEDICWVKTNKTNATPGLRHDSHTLFQRSKEHCLMGIKGTVRRSTDGHIIHANIDTDVIIAEEPPYGSTAKPEDMYRIVEHFSLGRRRLELFGEDHNIRSGWLTVGKDLSSSNFNAEGYLQNFADKDGKVWQGGGGRNPPPEAGHLVVTTPDIEALRPKSPMKNQQQQAAQAISTTSTNAANNNSNRRSTTTTTVTANSPHHHQDSSSTTPNINININNNNSNNPPTWAPAVDAFKGGIMGPASDFDSYVAFNPNFPKGNSAADFNDFDSHRGGMNL